MNRSRLAAAVAGGIAVLTSTLAAGSFSASAQSAAAAEVSSSPLRLTTPTEIHAFYYRGRANFDAGMRLIAQNSPFEVWSKRPS